MDIENLWFTSLISERMAVLVLQFLNWSTAIFISWLGPKWCIPTRTFLKSLIWHTRGTHSFFSILTSLWCKDKSVDVHHLPLDIQMTEGSLHALFCCRFCYWYWTHDRPFSNRRPLPCRYTLTPWDLFELRAEISSQCISTCWIRCGGQVFGLSACFREKSTISVGVTSLCTSP